MNGILPGILAWSVFSQEKGLDFNGHLIVGPDAAVLIDPPPVSAAQAEAIERAGRPAAIVITNAHHTRDAASLSKRWNAPILVPKLDAALLPDGVRPGGTYGEGDLLPGGLKAIGLTGQKTPGETALLCSRQSALIVGDALIGRPAGSLSLLPDGKYADPRAARAGLRRLLDFPFEALLVGDGASLVQGGRGALEAFLSAPGA
jgi:glyoxylase-like metal-dependent hydrolase (beta-lactamase superfamily II)